MSQHTCSTDAQTQNKHDIKNNTKYHQHLSVSKQITLSWAVSHMVHINMGEKHPIWCTDSLQNQIT